MKFLPADIILTSKFSLTKWFMGLFQSDIVNWGHTVLVENENVIIEAKQGVKRVSMVAWLESRKAYKVVRLETLTDMERALIVESVKSKVGLDYGTLRYVLQFLDHITFSNFFTRQFLDDDQQICSSLVAWGYHNGAGFQFNGVRWSSCDPDDIEDEVEKNPNFITIAEVP